MIEHVRRHNRERRVEQLTAQWLLSEGSMIASCKQRRQVGEARKCVGRDGRTNRTTV